MTDLGKNLFKDFVLENQDKESDIDYFYILEYLEENKLNISHINEIMSERFKAHKQKQDIVKDKGITK